MLCVVCCVFYLLYVPIIAYLICSQMGSVDLLDLMGSTPPTDHASSAASNIPSDFSFLNPQPPPPKQENPASLALSLFENPMGSLKIPTEYSRYPVVAGWDNKVSKVGG